MPQCAWILYLILMFLNIKSQKDDIKCIQYFTISPQNNTTPVNAGLWTSVDI